MSKDSKTMQVDLSEEKKTADPNIQAYLDQITGATSKEETEEPKDIDPETLRDKTFDTEDNAFQEAMIDTKKVEVSDEDKSAFLRAVLHDTPVVLNIPLCDEQINIKIRARNNFEQQCIFAAVEQDLKEEVIPYDAVNYVTQLQKYAAPLMIEAIDGKVFCPAVLNNEKRVVTKEDIQKGVVTCRQLKATFIDGMSMGRWLLLLNAMRVFEAKMATMSTEVVNESFWKTEG